MEGAALAPRPQDACYLSDKEYKDDSIHVRLFDGDYMGVHYSGTHIKISHPSQLRAIPAHQVNQPDAVFSAWSNTEARCHQIANAANAVVGINGDFYTNGDQCTVVMRQCIQVRNQANGMFDILVIDKNGDFDIIPSCTQADYVKYYEAHAPQMYQAFCFGPMLVKDGENALKEDYNSPYMMARKKTQRVAIAQLDELEYAIITNDGDAQFYTEGLSVYDFASLCENVGYALKPEGGFKIAYNLDGGNSASLVFKQKDDNGNLIYKKLNMPERERDLADMICFVTLVK